MATNNYEAKECIFQWKIENASQCWWLKNCEKLQSPSFIADALLRTKWSLCLYPMGRDDEHYIRFSLYRLPDCSGPDLIDVDYQLAFLGKDGRLLTDATISKRNFTKGLDWGLSQFKTREKVFSIEREAYLPDDILTVQCTLRKMDENPACPKYLYGRTAMKVNRKSFKWRIDEVSTLETNSRYEFKDTLFDFHLILNADFDRLDIDMISFYEEVNYVSFNVFIKDSKGKIENCGAKAFIASDLKKGVSRLMNFPEKLLEDKSRYLPNDVISLEIEFTFATITNFGGVKNSISLANNVVISSYCIVGDEKSENKSVLIDDFKSLYEDGIFANTEVRTLTKTFSTHKGILSARSPVFKRMFSNDMKEANSGHVDIEDFKDDTVHRMLLFIYTDILEELQFESAIDLYKIADKYEILSLKSRCYTFLIDNLCPSIVFEVLVLADLHQDGGLKNAAEDYILEHDEVFDSLEWKRFMDSNIKLAADVMYRKVSTVRIYRGSK